MNMFNKFLAPALCLVLMLSGCAYMPDIAPTMSSEPMASTSLPVSVSTSTPAETEPVETESQATTLPEDTTEATEAEPSLAAETVATIPTEPTATVPTEVAPTEPVETTAPQQVEIPDFFEVEEGYPADALEMAVTLYYSAPEVMRQVIVDCGTTIYMVNSPMLDPDLHYGIKGIIGVTFSNCKTIQLASGVVSVSRATIHEMAHLYDFVYNISSEDEFVAVYEEEYPNLYTPDGIAANYQYNRREYFAECTKLYVQYPDILKSWGSKTYSYLENLFR